MTNLNWTGWSEWRPLGMDYGLDMLLVPEKPGSYVISAGKTINRVLGADEEGILSIGESDNLQRRLKQFADCSLTPGAAAHKGGQRFALLRFTDHYPYTKLRYRWKMTASKVAAVELEGAMQFEYLKTFLELPPLNFQLNQKSFTITGSDILDQYIAETAAKD